MRAPSAFSKIWLRAVTFGLACSLGLKTGAQTARIERTDSAEVERQRRDLAADLRRAGCGAGPCEDTALMLFELALKQSRRADSAQSVEQTIDLLSVGSPQGYKQLEAMLGRGGDPRRTGEFIETFFRQRFSSMHEAEHLAGKPLTYTPVLNEEVRSARQRYIRSIENLKAALKAGTRSRLTAGMTAGIDRGQFQVSTGLIANLITDKPATVKHAYLNFLITDQELQRAEQQNRMEQAHAYLALARTEAVLNLAASRVKGATAQALTEPERMLEAQAEFLDAQAHYDEARRIYRSFDPSDGVVFHGVTFTDETQIYKELAQTGSEIAVRTVADALVRTLEHLFLQNGRIAEGGAEKLRAFEAGLPISTWVDSMTEERSDGVSDADSWHRLYARGTPYLGKALAVEGITLKQVSGGQTSADGGFTIELVPGEANLTAQDERNPGRYTAFIHSAMIGIWAGRGSVWSISNDTILKLGGGVNVRIGIADGGRDRSGIAANLVEQAKLRDSREMARIETECLVARRTVDLLTPFEEADPEAAERVVWSRHVLAAFAPLGIHPGANAGSNSPLMLVDAPGDTGGLQAFLDFAGRGDYSVRQQELRAEYIRAQGRLTTRRASIGLSGGFGLTATAAVLIEINRARSINRQIESKRETVSGMDRDLNRLEAQIHALEMLLDIREAQIKLDGIPEVQRARHAIAEADLMRAIQSLRLSFREGQPPTVQLGRQLDRVDLERALERAWAGKSRLSINTKEMQASLETVLLLRRRLEDRRSEERWSIPVPFGAPTALYNVAISSFEDAISLLKRLRIIRAPARPDLKAEYDREIARLEQALKNRQKSGDAEKNLALQHYAAAKLRVAAASRPPEIRTATRALDRALVEAAAMGIDLRNIDAQVSEAIMLPPDAAVVRISSGNPDDFAVYRVESHGVVKLMVERAPNVTTLQKLSSYGLRGSSAISPTASPGTITVLTQSRSLGGEADPGENYVVTAFNPILNEWTEFTVRKENGASLTALQQRSDTLSVVEAALGLEWLLAGNSRLNVLMTLDQEQWGTQGQLGVNLTLPNGQFLTIGWDHSENGGQPERWRVSFSPTGNRAPIHLILGAANDGSRILPEVQLYTSGGVRAVRFSVGGSAYGADGSVFVNLSVQPVKSSIGYTANVILSEFQGSTVGSASAGMVMNDRFSLAAGAAFDPWSPVAQIQPNAAARLQLTDAMAIDIYDSLRADNMNSLRATLQRTMKSLSESASQREQRDNYGSFSRLLAGFEDTGSQRNAVAELSALTRLLGDDSVLQVLASVPLGEDRSQSVQGLKDTAALMISLHNQMFGGPLGLNVSAGFVHDAGGDNQLEVSLRKSLLNEPVPYGAKRFLDRGQKVPVTGLVPPGFGSWQGYPSGARSGQLPQTVTSSAAQPSVDQLAREIQKDPALREAFARSTGIDVAPSPLNALTLQKLRAFVGVLPSQGETVASYLGQLRSRAPAFRGKETAIRKRLATPDGAAADVAAGVNQIVEAAKADAYLRSVLQSLVNVTVTPLGAVTPPGLLEDFVGGLVQSRSSVTVFLRNVQNMEFLTVFVNAGGSPSREAFSDFFGIRVDDIRNLQTVVNGSSFDLTGVEKGLQALLRIRSAGLVTLVNTVYDLQLTQQGFIVNAGRFLDPVSAGNALDTAAAQKISPLLDHRPAARVLFGLNIPLSGAITSPQLRQALFDLAGSPQFNPASVLTALLFIEQANASSDSLRLVQEFYLLDLAYGGPAKNNSDGVFGITTQPGFNSAVFFSSLRRSNSVYLTMKRAGAPFTQSFLSLFGIGLDSVFGNPPALSAFFALLGDPALDLGNPRKLMQFIRTVVAGDSLNRALAANSAYVRAFGEIYPEAAGNPQNNPPFRARLLSIAGSPNFDQTTYLHALTGAAELYDALESNRSLAQAFNDLYPQPVDSPRANDAFRTLLFTITGANTFAVETFLNRLPVVDRLYRSLRGNARLAAAFSDLETVPFANPGAVGSFRQELFDICGEPSFRPDDFLGALPAADQLNRPLQANATLTSSFNNLEPTPVRDPKTEQGVLYRGELFGIAGSRDFGVSAFLAALPPADQLNKELQKNGPLAAAFNDLETVAVTDPRSDSGAEFRAELFSIAGTPNFMLRRFVTTLPAADQLNKQLQADRLLAESFNNLEAVAAGDPRTAAGGEYRKELFSIAGSADFAMGQFVTALQAADQLNRQLQTNGALVAAFNNLEPVRISNPATSAGDEYRRELFGIVGSPDFAFNTFTALLTEADRLNGELRRNSPLATAFNSLELAPANDPRTDEIYRKELFAITGDPAFGGSTRFVLVLPVAADLSRALRSGSALQQSAFGQVFNAMVSQPNQSAAYGAYLKTVFALAADASQRYGDPQVRGDFVRNLPTVAELLRNHEVAEFFGMQGLFARPASDPDRRQAIGFLFQLAVNFIGPTRRPHDSVLAGREWQIGVNTPGEYEQQVHTALLLKIALLARRQQLAAMFDLSASLNTSYRNAGSDDPGGPVYSADMRLLFSMASQIQQAGRPGFYRDVNDLLESLDLAAALIPAFTRVQGLQGGDYRYVWQAAGTLTRNQDREMVIRIADEIRHRGIDTLLGLDPGSGLTNIPLTNKVAELRKTYKGPLSLETLPRLFELYGVHGEVAVIKRLQEAMGTGYAPGGPADGHSVTFETARVIEVLVFGHEEARKTRYSITANDSTDGETVRTVRGSSVTEETYAPSGIVRRRIEDLAGHGMAVITEFDRDGRASREWPEGRPEDQTLFETKVIRPGDAEYQRLQGLLGRHSTRSLKVVETLDSRTGAASWRTETGDLIAQLSGDEVSVVADVGIDLHRVVYRIERWKSPRQVLRIDTELASDNAKQHGWLKAVTTDLATGLKTVNLFDERGRLVAILDSTGANGQLSWTAVRYHGGREVARLRYVSSPGALPAIRSVDEDGNAEYDLRGSTLMRTFIPGGVFRDGFGRIETRPPPAGEQPGSWVVEKDAAHGPDRLHIYRGSVRYSSQVGRERTVYGESGKTPLYTEDVVTGRQIREYRIPEPGEKPGLSGIRVYDLTKDGTPNEMWSSVEERDADGSLSRTVTRQGGLVYTYEPLPGSMDGAGGGTSRIETADGKVVERRSIGAVVWEVGDPGMCYSRSTEVVQGTGQTITRIRDANGREVAEIVWARGDSNIVMTMIERGEDGLAETGRSVYRLSKAISRQIDAGTSFARLREIVKDGAKARLVGGSEAPRFERDATTTVRRWDAQFLSDGSMGRRYFSEARQLGLLVSRKEGHRTTHYQPLPWEAPTFATDDRIQPPHNEVQRFESEPVLANNQIRAVRVTTTDLRTNQKAEEIFALDGSASDYRRTVESKAGGTAWRMVTTPLVDEVFGTIAALRMATGEGARIAELSILSWSDHDNSSVIREVGVRGEVQRFIDGDGQRTKEAVFDAITFFDFDPTGAQSGSRTYHRYLPQADSLRETSEATLIARGSGGATQNSRAYVSRSGRPVAKSDGSFSLPVWKAVYAGESFRGECATNQFYDSLGRLLYEEDSLGFRTNYEPGYPASLPMGTTTNTRTGFSGETYSSEYLPGGKWRVTVEYPERHEQVSSDYDNAGGLTRTLTPRQRNPIFGRRLAVPVHNSANVVVGSDVYFADNLGRPLIRLYEDRITDFSEGSGETIVTRTLFTPLANHQKETLRLDRRGLPVSVSYERAVIRPSEAEGKHGNGLHLYGQLPEPARRVSGVRLTDATLVWMEGGRITCVLVGSGSQTFEIRQLAGVGNESSPDWRPAWGYVQLKPDVKRVQLKAPGDLDAVMEKELSGWVGIGDDRGEISFALVRANLQASPDPFSGRTSNGQYGWDLLDASRKVIGTVVFGISAADYSRAHPEYGLDPKLTSPDIAAAVYYLDHRTDYLTDSDLLNVRPHIMHVLRNTKGQWEPAIWDAARKEWFKIKASGAAADILEQSAQPFSHAAQLNEKGRLFDEKDAPQGLVDWDEKGRASVRGIVVFSPSER